MAVPATGTPPPSQPRERDGDLVVEWRGPHALIRLSDEVAGVADVLGTIPWVQGNVLVLASASAHRHPGLFGAVRDWLDALRSGPGGSGLHSVWLAVPNLGNPSGTSVSWLYGLAADFGVEVIAPDGPLTTVGAGMYVNRAEGGVGWRGFGPRDKGDVVGCRFPVPTWEQQLPQDPIAAAGLVTEPVPAGLAVRPAGLPVLSHTSPAFRVPLHSRILKLVIGQPGVDVSAIAVAQLVRHLPEPVRRAVLYVPVSPSSAAPEWAAELAVLLGHDVMLTAGLETMNSAGVIRTVVLGPQGEQVLVPLAALLRHRPGAAAPEVVEIAPPPPGWEKHGPCCYRRVGQERFSVLAEVLPGGLHVRLEAEKSVFTGRLDSRSWTLVIGGAGRQVTEGELVAARELLGGLTPHQCHTAEVRVLGTVDPEGLAALGAHIRSVGASLEPETEVVTPPHAAEEPAPRPVESTIEAALAGRFGKPALGGETLPVPRSGESGRPTLEGAPIAVTASPVATVSGPTGAKPHPEAKPEPRAKPETESKTKPEAEAERHAPKAEEPAVAARPRPGKPVDLADRPSTQAEQTRLVAGAGARYTEALATVNVALSAWPMLKPEAKADYVAVCLYLGRGEGGAVALAEALAEGREPFDGYLPCLVSGLRRLPTHRKVVLRQERVGEKGPHAAGTVLCEPGFLSASAKLDVTTASADLDQLIWPVSARRTSELIMGRGVDEVVFPVGRRFKALVLRTREPDDRDGPQAPRTALLTRELLPDEDPQSPQALERDRTALPRLERAWQDRQGAEMRLIEEPDVLARLTAPMMRAADVGVELRGAVGASS